MLPLPSGICWGKPTPTHSVSIPKPIPFPPKIELIHLHAPRDARRGQGNHQLARGGGQDEDSVSNPHERDAFAAGQFRGPAPARRFTRRQDAIHSFCFSKPHPCIRNPPWSRERPIPGVQQMRSSVPGHILRRKTGQSGPPKAELWVLDSNSNGHSSRPPSSRSRLGQPGAEAGAKRAGEGNVGADPGLRSTGPGK